MFNEFNKINKIIFVKYGTCGLSVFSRHSHIKRTSNHPFVKKYCISSSPMKLDMKLRFYEDANMGNSGYAILNNIFFFMSFTQQANKGI